MTRVLLVALCALLVALALFGMRHGWRSRLAAQAHLPALPAVPDRLGAPTLSTTGLYVGSSFASSWQDRVLHGSLGERADASLELHDAGVLIRRHGADDVFVPRAAVVGARLAPGLAGKVVGEGGLLVLRWRLGVALIDSGFRADDKSTYVAWVRRLDGKVSA
jgi:hypothetical protein